MNKDISTGAIPEKSHFNNSIEDALQKRVEKIEMTLFEVTARQAVTAEKQNK